MHAHRHDLAATTFVGFSFVACAEQELHICFPYVSLSFFKGRKLVVNPSFPLAQDGAQGIGPGEGGGGR